MNIFKEIEVDLGKPYPNSGDLSSWANQGVLLLNATLTVRASPAGSHQGKGWEQFTDAVIEKISQQREGVVFLLWADLPNGKELDRSIEASCINSLVILTFKCKQRLLVWNKHFSKTNELLHQMKLSTIDW